MGAKEVILPVLKRIADEVRVPDLDAGPLPKVKNEAREVADQGSDESCDDSGEHKVPRAGAAKRGVLCREKAVSQRDQNGVKREKGKDLIPDKKLCLFHRAVDSAPCDADENRGDRAEENHFAAGFGKRENFRENE